MLMMDVVEVGLLMSNSYVVFDPDLREAIIIDAGDEADKILRMIEKNDVKVKAIYATHGHFDHVLAVREVKEQLGCKFYIHREDLPLLERASESYMKLFGEERLGPPAPDGYVSEGDIIKIGDYEMKVIHTPGHTSGSVCYVIEGAVFTGDTLFAGSIGRTDLPGGNLQKLIDSLTRKLLSLPEDYSVFPGHGPSTTIGIEKLYNPFIGIGGLYREKHL
ncbi:MAG: MBL fold metallo-hydrolase [Nitrososphaerota archaeon]